MSIIIEPNSNILENYEYSRYFRTKFNYIPEDNDNKVVLFEDNIFNCSISYNIISIYPLSVVTCNIKNFLSEISEIIYKTIVNCVSIKLSNFVNFKLFFYVPENNNLLDTDTSVIKEELYEKDLVNNKELNTKCRLYIKEFKHNIKTKNIRFHL